MQISIAKWQCERRRRPCVEGAEGEEGGEGVDVDGA